MIKGMKVYVYTLNSRVVWWDLKLQQIPVIAEMYMVHRSELPELAKIGDCVNYIIKNNHKFEDQLISSPLVSEIGDEESKQIKLVNLKVSIYMKLVDFINCSYQSAFPAVFTEEADQIEILARSLVNETSLDTQAIETHRQFVNKLISDKKTELKTRFISLIHQLKEAHTIDEVQKIGYTIVYEGINVV